MKKQFTLISLVPSILICSSALADHVVQDFESYDSTPALMKDVSHIKDTAKVELEFDTGVDESSSMNLALNTSKDPWYTQVEFNVDPVNLAKAKAVTIAIKLLPGSSNEYFEVQLKDKHGSLIAMGERIGTQSISTGEFDIYTIDLKKAKKKELSRISVNAAAKDGGTAYVALDNITVIDK